jgi:hypothetical protein
MHSARPLPGTTNEGQTLGFHPENRDMVPEEHHEKCSRPVLPPRLAKAAAASIQTPDTQEELVTHNLHHNQLSYLPLITSDHSHHAFLHLCEFRKNL